MACRSWRPSSARYRSLEGSGGGGLTGLEDEEVIVEFCLVDPTEKVEDSTGGNYCMSRGVRPKKYPVLGVMRLDGGFALCQKALLPVLAFSLALPGSLSI